MTVQAIITDIEGTTTDIDFVHRILFPYSRENLEKFIKSSLQNPEILEALGEVALKIGLKAPQDSTLPFAHKDLDQVIQKLRDWIDQDLKEGSLKKIQGMIWEQGYQVGAFKGHLYEDVPVMLKIWESRGTILGVYSSGSIAAQKLLFKFSQFGDLCDLFTWHFDTSTGPKKSADSYRKIATTLSLPPQSILFLTDSHEEATSALSAGLKIILIERQSEVTERDNTLPLKGLSIPRAQDFFQVDKALSQL